MTRSAARLALLALLILAGQVGGAAAQQAEVLPDRSDPGAVTPDDAQQQPPFRQNDRQQRARSEAMPNRMIETADDAPRYVVAPVLTVDQERLFTDSAWGRRAQGELEEAGRAIADENDRLAAQLSAEEAQLTQQRSALEPAEFRRLAEAFDARATEIRRERAKAVQDLNARADADRAAFYQAALPVMGEMMQQRGAVAVLDRRTVFVSLDAIDITPDLIERLDETVGDGAGATTDSDAAAPVAD
ncbi:OmpH family outer membrane protein [Paracoccus salsus]|uniref:OmpH family outer membrane protein n=1 Tax=Paracoccus salsus TaxID=2911061 RepID=UPI001F1F7FA6|nr:OmpH family outer membrane protein [Paracoccus salsus]MCF3974130.1 OmpH family outer membrane protein [Paracoccus salsus]